MNKGVAVSVVSTVLRIDQAFTDLVMSLLSQTVGRLEWFIIAGTEMEYQIDAVLSDMCAGERLKIYLLSDADARKLAIVQSAGSCICFLDSGSAVEPTYLEKCVWFLDANPQDACCNAWTVFADGQRAGINLQDGMACIEAVASGGQGMVIRRCVCMELMENGWNASVAGMAWAKLLLTMAAHGYWGSSIPEYLHRRCRKKAPDEQYKADIHHLIRSEYPALLKNFPVTEHPQRQPYEPLRHDFPFDQVFSTAADKLHVMLVIPWMVTGGADKFNLDLVDMLVKQGHAVTICATLPGDHPWEQRFTGLTPDVFVLRRFLQPHDFPRFLAYLIKSRNIDALVIYGSTIGYQLLPYLRARAPETAFLDLNHVEEPGWNSGGHPRFGVGYQDVLDLNIVSTEHLAGWMAEKGADEHRIRVLHTGVEEYSESEVQLRRGEIRREFGLAGDLPVIIFAGRLCQQKRPDVLAKVLNALHEKDLLFHAFIIGDGDQRPLFESMLDADLKASVLMCGSVDHDRWLDLLQASDVFLLPSAYEGISIALLEAMSVGVVPVVSDVGGQEEVVRDAAGILIPHGDNECEDYAGAIQTLMLDDQRRKAMGQSARALIGRSFSRRSTLAGFETIVAEARSMASDASRSDIPLGLATELAISAVEMDCLNDRVHSLWWAAGGQGSAGKFPLLMHYLLKMRQSKTGILLSRNRVFQRILAVLFKSSK